MANLALPYVHAYTSRGKQFFYYRRNGKRIRIQGEPATPQFLAEYQRIHTSFEKGDKVLPGKTPGTFAWLLAKWYASPEFSSCEASTRTERRRLLAHLEVKYGAKPIVGLTKKVVIKIRNDLARKPVTANNTLRTLKTFLEWARKNDELPVNPAADVDFLKVKSDGWQPWPDVALKRFADKAEGAARIAFFLALCTGQRRADVLSMRWDAIDSDTITLVQAKTKVPLVIPLMPILQTELAKWGKVQEARIEERRAAKLSAATPLNIVARDNGQPYTDDGFGSIWNRAQHDCGCAGLPFHGLRRNATQALFEAGCTPQQVQAITGHQTLEMVAYYGKGANQALLARQAISKLKQVD